MGRAVRKTAIILVLGLGILSACGRPAPLQPFVGSSTHTATEINSANPALHGQAGDVEFALDEDVFTVERPRSILFIALALYLPFLVL